MGFGKGRAGELGLWNAYACLFILDRSIQCPEIDIGMDVLTLVFQVLNAEIPAFKSSSGYSDSGGLHIDLPPGIPGGVLISVFTDSGFAH